MHLEVAMNKSLQVLLLIQIFFFFLNERTIGEKSKAIQSNAIKSFSPGGQYIMLTFDNCPHSFVSEKLLNIFKEKNVRATFFITGSKSIYHPNLLKRMIAEGHEIGINGWNNEVITNIEQSNILKNIRMSSTLISNVTYVKPKFFRPYLGQTSNNINSYINENENMKVVLWSLDSKDLTRTDSKTFVSNIISNAKPGDVVRFHETKITLQSMSLIVDELYKKGYEFLTLSQVSSFPDDSPH